MIRTEPHEDHVIPPLLESHGRWFLLAALGWITAGALFAFADWSAGRPAPDAPSLAVQHPQKGPTQ